MDELTDEETSMVMEKRPDVIIVLEGGKIGMIASRRVDDKIAIVNRDEGRLEIHESEGVTVCAPEGSIPLRAKGRYRARK